MQWTVPNVNTMLALRVSIDNDRWDQQWQHRQNLHLSQQHQRALDRQSRQQRSAEEALKPFLIRFLLMQAPSQVAAYREVPSGVATPPAPPPRVLPSILGEVTLPKRFLFRQKNELHPILLSVRIDSHDPYEAEMCAYSF